ncbi:hypothetical protein ROZALSC1DRAFT_24099 [Rozella allomycis CSF55]|uniref:SWIM-type domain-containing protein n=1 Tax=Rozella allomycis (strain CSF55) TaxID=988480 RepID=A0A4P9YEE9_ROZAC|nr:hypothetical protein ROZALSC1DRAFT_24099 [Rozella allomycis CSF55]
MITTFPFRQDCPEQVKKSMEKASLLALYLLQRPGPLAFLIKEDNHSNDLESKEKKYKVILGSINRCSCPWFKAKSDLCPHIVWVLEKVMHVPRDHSLMHQLSYNERQINEILNFRESFVKNHFQNHDPNVIGDPNSKGPCIRKEIHEDDIWYIDFQ